MNLLVISLLEQIISVSPIFSSHFQIVSCRSGCYKLELKLTFRDNVKNICTSKNIKEIDKQLMEYILNKLNEIPNFNRTYKTNFLFINKCFNFL